MSDASSGGEAEGKKPAAPAKKGKGKLLILVGGGVGGLLAVLGGLYAFVPAVSGPINACSAWAGMRRRMPRRIPAPSPPPGPSPSTSRPIFIEMPEINVTLPNGGRPRQLRINLAIEISGDPVLVRPTITNPRVYDSLLLYLRTLRDSELEGALALDRLRGDLYRRVDLLVGPNVVRDVLITSLVIA